MNLPLSLEAISIVDVVYGGEQFLDEQVRELMKDERFAALKTIRVDREDENLPEDDGVPDGWEVEHLEGGFVFSKSA
jgi:hypothetical protein